MICEHLGLTVRTDPQPRLPWKLNTEKGQRSSGWAPIAHGKVRPEWLGKRGQAAVSTNCLGKWHSCLLEDLLVYRLHTHLRSYGYDVCGKYRALRSCICSQFPLGAGASGLGACGMWS